MELQINGLETKIEKIRSLLEKQFRIMIVKMIQNLENTVELQINRLETRIEKMQDMFNKNLEEIMKSKSIMNNAITGIKSTLEGTNIRITEAEERISEVENRLVEKNIKQKVKKNKEFKKMKTSSEISGTMLNAPTFES